MEAFGFGLSALRVVEGLGQDLTAQVLASTFGLSHGGLRTALDQRQNTRTVDSPCGRQIFKKDV